jgi:hypothetical protein
MTRSAQEVWAVMEQQSAEDAVWADALAAVSTMSDAELDAELRGLDLDPAALEKDAHRIWEAWSATQTAPIEGVERAPRPVEPIRRRRPLATAVWIAAAAAAAATAGGLIYTLVHRGPEPPAPAPPTPSPSAPPPVESPPEIAMTPAQLRSKAAAALDDGRPGDCLKLLDDARRTDPAGDASPETKRLRQRAETLLGGKPQ